MFDNLQWASVSSSNVDAVAYDPTFRRLFVRFNSGAIYKYDDVPELVWMGFLAAGSKGQYLYRAIRGWGSDSIYGYDRVS